MKTYFECLPCFVRQALEASRQATNDEDLHERVLRKVLKAVSVLDLREPSPVMIGHIHRVVREVTGNDDPYRDPKKRFNTAAMDLYDEFERVVDSSDDPIDTAIRFAISGNIIDYVVGADLDGSDVRGAAQHALEDSLPDGAVARFKQAVQSARKILYLGDNAGEIVFDKLLIERLPRDKVTFVVKGRPVVNDVTMKDAQFVGMTDLVEVIDNGTDIPGTYLPVCSDTLVRRFEEADLVISKGQGNYECLAEEKNIQFLFSLDFASSRRR
ncbi:DUF89 domain-containing protein [Thermodesulfobacteriota bacterium]